MRTATLIVTGWVCLASAACAQDTKNLERKADELAGAVAALDKKMDSLQSTMRESCQASATTRPPPRPEPDPQDVFAVPVDGAASLGPADALVTIVKGYEYACPACAKVNATIDQLRTDYGDDLRVVYRHFVVHPKVATEPALAACAATRQGKFREMDALLWAKAYATRTFDRANLEALAREAGLDLARFKAEMDGDCKAIIAKDQAELRAAGLAATPTFFINGRYASGAKPIDRFKAIIDEELAKAKQRVAAGTARADYYRTWVLEKGLAKFTPKAP